MNVQTDLVVIYKPNEALQAYNGNARTHSIHQIRQIADSIKTFGIAIPVLIDRKNRIITGHRRVEAAKLLGKTQASTINPTEGPFTL